MDISFLYLYFKVMGIWVILEIYLVGKSILIFSSVKVGDFENN